MKKLLLLVPVVAALMAATSIGASAHHTVAGRRHMALGRQM